MSTQRIAVIVIAILVAIVLVVALVVAIGRGGGDASAPFAPGGEPVVELGVIERGLVVR